MENSLRSSKKELSKIYQCAVCEAQNFQTGLRIRYSVQTGKLPANFSDNERRARTLLGGSDTVVSNFLCHEVVVHSKKLSGLVFNAVLYVVQSHERKVTYCGVIGSNSKSTAFCDTEAVSPIKADISEADIANLKKLFSKRVTSTHLTAKKILTRIAEKPTSFRKMWLHT